MVTRPMANKTPKKRVPASLGAVRDTNEPTQGQRNERQTVAACGATHGTNRQSAWWLAEVSVLIPNRTSPAHAEDIQSIGRAVNLGWPQTCAETGKHGGEQTCPQKDIQTKTNSQYRQTDRDDGHNPARCARLSPGRLLPSMYPLIQHSTHLSTKDFK